MTPRHWLSLGLKLLGVYFVVDGLGRCAWAGLMWVQTLPAKEDWGGLYKLQWSTTLGQAAAYVLAGMVLVFGTSWCVWLAELSGWSPRAVPVDKPLRPLPERSAIQDFSNRSGG